MRYFGCDINMVYLAAHKLGETTHSGGSGMYVLFHGHLCIIEYYVLIEAEYLKRQWKQIKLITSDSNATLHQAPRWL